MLKMLKVATTATTTTATTLLLLAVVIAVLLSTVDCSRHGRHKRRIDEFAAMISVKTDINPLDFNGYGHWCGLGGAGETVDAIDNCCKIHDGCYGRVNRNECKSLLKYKVYTTAYHWQNHQGEITCTDDELCPKTLCECDRAASKCFGEHQDVYNKTNKHSTVLRGLSKLLGMKPAFKNQE